MHTANTLAAWGLATHDALQAASERVGIGLREASALTLVDGHQEATVEWLRARVGLSQPGTVRLVDRLVEARMITRSARQGRSVMLSLTSTGRATLRRWIQQRDAALAMVTEGLNDRDVAGLNALLAKSLRATDRARAEADATCRTCDWPACGEDCPVDLSVGS
jgi:DNA-binding MarR family transcriptional regulator